jgi:four helix bundle protein
MTSVPLNVAEGYYSRGGNRKARYHTALGSAREVLACFEVAGAMGMTPQIDPASRDRLDRIIRTLYKLSR